MRVNPRPLIAVAAFAALLATADAAGGRGTHAPEPPQQAQRAESAAARLFEANCAACHGSDGRGADRGPDIVTPGIAASRPIRETARIIREGIPAGGMPRSNLDPSAIDALARHVRTLAEAAREPRTFRRVRLSLRDGGSIEGLVQNESSFDLQLLTGEGTLRALTRDQIAALTEIGRAPVPDLKPREVADRFTPGDWPTYNGSPGGNRHTALRQIAPDNVGQMRLRWVFPVGSARNLRTTPVVVDGIMYVTAPNEVYAIDARSGREIWHYARPRTPGVIGDAGAGVNRGVAIRGDRLFVATDDARLLALHRATGQLLWDTRMADHREHYGATGAPLVVGDLVVSGVSGGDEGVRGFVAAFDAATGKEAWRFWTVPAPGEPGSETWKGKAIHHPCAATWLTGSYDPATNLLFWTTGNPCPDYNGAERIGDNLWSNSVVALDPATGKMRWHYQFTPHDLNDWDAVQTVVAVDAPFQGRQRQLLLQANRNGFFYVLDRATGKLLLAEPFVTKMNWAKRIGPDGRPERIAGTEPSVRGTIVCPSVVGATNWMSPAYSPDTGLYYVMALERCGIYRKSAVWFEPGESFYGGATRNVPGETGRKYLRAIDVQTGRIAWEHAQVGTGGSWGGVLTTASGLVFFGEDSGAFAAADARTGRLLWHFQANTVWRASPMAYGIGGEQFVAVAGGGSIFAFGLPPEAPKVFESDFSAAELPFDPDPSTAAWKDAPRVVADRDKWGAPLDPPTEIRSRWTKEHLYLLYICPYDRLNLKPDPTTTDETPRLWNWDVAEAFIGSDFERIASYKEFQVSPQGEWVDLDIDRADTQNQPGMRWNSGFAVRARIDDRAKVWYGLMRIPFTAIDTRTPEPGRELRIGLYRIHGVDPAKKFYAWRPTGAETFHVPQAFGTLRLR